MSASLRAVAGLGPVEAGRAVRIGYRSAELVSSAASMFERYRLAEHVIRVGSRADGSGEWVEVGADRVELEGPRSWVEISPGSVRVGRRDPVRRDRALARAARARTVAERLRLAWAEQGPDFPRHASCWGWCSHVECQERWAGRDSAKITCWSAKSRRSMIHRLATLDYAPLFVRWCDGVATVPAMVTLTYPGDWLAVARSHRASRRHVEQLRKRWDRRWSDFGFPLVGVWKREFQGRGAPHYHILCVPPTDPSFRAWLSEAWAEIVGSAWCGDRCWEAGRGCCERGRHVLAGTGVDYREGSRATDPRRLAIYFSKHGGYSAKEYQNEGPAEWLGNGGLGRFWGVWGLAPAVQVVGVSPELGLLVARTLRRLEHSRRYRVPKRVLRCTVEHVDAGTGELLPHRRGCFRSSTVTVARFKGSAGFVVVNDGPALAASLARVAGLVEPDPSSRAYAEQARSRGRALLGVHGARWWSSTGRRQGFLP